MLYHILRITSRREVRATRFCVSEREVVATPGMRSMARHSFLTSLTLGSVQRTHSGPERGHRPLLSASPRIAGPFKLPISPAESILAERTERWRSSGGTTVVKAMHVPTTYPPPRRWLRQKFPVATGNNGPAEDGNLRGSAIRGGRRSTHPLRGRDLNGRFGYTSEETRH